MKNLFLPCLILLNVTLAFSQNNFSKKTKEFITHSDSIIVFQKAILIDGTASLAKDNQTVIIINGKIVWIGDDAKATIPANATILNLEGKAITPGWVMLHEHMYMPNFTTEFFYTLRQIPFSFPRLYLACGATTIRTAGSVSPYVDLEIKQQIEDGLLPGPNIDLTAPYLDFAPIKTAKQTIQFVNFWADQGFTSFKSHASVDKTVLKHAIKAAHKRNLKVTAHLGRVTYQEAIDFGVDHIEHGFTEVTDFVLGKKENEHPRPSEARRSVVQLDLASKHVKDWMNRIIENNTAITSTLAVFEGFISNQPPPSTDLLDMFSTDTREYYLERYENTIAIKNQTVTDSIYVKTGEMEKMFSDMGGLLTVGTDPTGNGGTIAGYGNWRAIELLVEQAGFTPLEAIKIATLNGAKSLNMEASIGSIEVGKTADLIIVDGDPSKDIHEIRNVIYVFKNGIGYDSKKMIDSVRGRVGFE